MTFAVIKTGGKQYVVTPGQTLKIEKLPTNTGDSKIVTFDEVLLVVDDEIVKVGAPTVTGAKVTAERVSDGRAKKVTILRYKNKITYKKVKGHRQPFTEVKITSIN
ncbi:MAG: 50S ribosomal protein L21 [Candidatus Vogelbacteria bacterium]|nr:50S ribosomal protein L21 [Candidatus Vogelbacteria bacterium]